MALAFAGLPGKEREATTLDQISSDTDCSDDQSYSFMTELIRSMDLICATPRQATPMILMHLEEKSIWV